MKLFSHAAIFTRKTALWALFAVGAGACAGSNSPELVVAAKEDGAGLANRTGLATTGQEATEADGEEDENSQGHWDKIQFDRVNFDEVRSQVRKRYIDPKYDEIWAWAQAASFASASNTERPLLLLPESFYRARVDNPDEKGALKGKMFKLKPDDAFVFLEESKEKVEEKKRRLSDDEIRVLRDNSMARTRALHKAWDDINFGEKDFNRVLEFLNKEFKASPKWSIKNAWIAAAQGYLYALDPHSSLIARESWEESNRKTQDSSFEGIGAILTQRPDSEYTIVESPIYGQPAVKAGIRAGDMIVAIDGKDIKGESLSKVVSRIRGPAGTEVKLTVQREGEPEPKVVPIKRASISMKNVQGNPIEGYPGYASIKVTGFVKTRINGVERTTDDDLEAEVKRLSAAAPGGKLKGIVLDLRNNSGGLLHEGIKMADRFLKDGVIVSVKNRNAADNEVYRAVAEGTWDTPVIVLVNDGTASAAEIVASALQDNKRALVVGDRTFGKASVQTLFMPLFQDDYYIKMTVARYYGPLDRTLQVTGVHPDVEVTPSPDGKKPLGFREENLSGHLVPLDAEYVRVNADWAAKAKACAEANGKAKKIYESDPNPAIKFDWQLHYAADLLECSISTASKSGR